MYQYLQWNLSNPDTLGTISGVLFMGGVISGVS